MIKAERELSLQLLRSMIGLEKSAPISDILGKLASIEKRQDTNLRIQEQKEPKNDDNTPL